MAELAALFTASFAAATLVPLPSEAALFGYLKLYPDQLALAVATATLGNTAGGMTSYLVGRLIPPKETKGIAAIQRYGTPALLLAWLPLVGDALCVAAGWLRIRWPAALAFMAAGRLARYVIVASLV
ncbi:MAG TPA: DedA family protein [Burkholderiales bacterium]|nr:DedA family protein [Burkholderiales bacterium]